MRRGYNMRSAPPISKAREVLDRKAAIEEEQDKEVGGRPWTSGRIATYQIGEEKALRRPKSAYWLNLMMLGMESQQAIALRLFKLSKGGARARQETSRMVTEKLKAGMNAGRQMVKGGSPTSVLKAYRSKVRANIKRLSK
jgi:hypothetical protein